MCIPGKLCTKNVRKNDPFLNYSHQVRVFIRKGDIVQGKYLYLYLFWGTTCDQGHHLWQHFSDLSERCRLRPLWGVWQTVLETLSGRRVSFPEWEKSTCISPEIILSIFLQCMGGCLFAAYFCNVFQHFWHSCFKASPAASSNSRHDHGAAWL